ncbi:nucleoside 2-deoxyribosyltransferase [Candidatus Sumerlaeota bacterium]|nr:nucleoside 2-deoxyribosyltransferase [Candidatus Sumerlaeota bacterium]
MKRNPDFNQLRTAFLCGEPDYVPLMELGIARNIKEAYLGKPVRTLQDEIEFSVEAGYDYIKLQPIIDMDPANVRNKSSLKTKISENQDRVWASEHDGIIKNRQDFDRYIWPKKEDISYERFEQIKPLLPDGMRVIGQYGDIFTMVWEMMGFENFSLMLYMDPELVSALFEKIGDLILSMYENMVDFDLVGALWYTDDIAYASGLMMSPDALREYFFPWLDKMGKIARDHNLPFMYHSDGMLWEVFDDIIKAGVNAVHPIEPMAMDIVEVKKKYKGKLCVMGNIDLGYTLTRGTPEETAEEVKERLRAVAPGGGYCLGSSNSVPDYVKPDNYRAMVETAKKFGNYPIDI